jgi:Flp pilus assembly protein TadD
MVTRTRIGLYFVSAAVSAALLGGCIREQAQHNAKGNVFFHQGDIDGAIREYRAAIAAAPTDPAGHTLLGNALFEKGDLDGALAAYRDALSHDPRAGEARRGIGTTLLRQGKTAEAEKSFTELCASSPGDYQAEEALGKLLLARGDLDGAEAHLREAVRWARNDPAALYPLGLTLARKKQQAQALEVFDQLEAVTPDQPFAPYGRAIVAAQEGRSDEALAWLAKALDRGVPRLDEIEADPGLAPLRGDPRLQSLVAEARRRGPPKKGAP